MKRSTFKKYIQGFTLVETLIAIAILVLAIVGPLTIASSSLNAAYYAKDQVTAFYLTQEGIEYVRFLRDSNTLSNAAYWDAGFVANNSPVCSDIQPCGLDPLNIFATGQNALIPCSEKDCPVNFDTSTGLYRQTGSQKTSGLSPTNFTRSIFVEVVSPNEDKVTVTVSWKTGNLKSPNNFQITEYITNWQTGTAGTGIGGGDPGVGGDPGIGTGDDGGGTITLPPSGGGTLD